MYFISNCNLIDFLTHSLMRLKGQYWKDIETALQSARKYLLERDNFIEPPYTTMVILDIDETSLSNLDHTKSAGFGELKYVISLHRTCYM